MGVSRSRRAFARHRTGSQNMFRYCLVDEGSHQTCRSSPTPLAGGFAMLMLVEQLPASNLDIRPYLHIHDLDFRLIVNANKPPTGVVVGVTVSAALAKCSHSHYVRG